MLRTGLVKLISHSEKGTETILHILKPPEVFGELLLSEERRSFTVIAIEDSLLTVISREHFLELFKQIPTIALNFITLLSKRLTRVQKVLADSGYLVLSPIGEGSPSARRKVWGGCSLGHLDQTAPDP